jgi:hypothetical protein
VTLLIQQRTSQLIGEPSGNTIKQAITALLGVLKQQGVVVAYDLDIQVAEAVGAVTIVLAVQPQSETTMVTVTTQVNLPGNG